MMRLKESSLETKQPYHIPGYCGYCPQFKYEIQETFGKTTHDLLTKPNISRSKLPVLTPLDDGRDIVSDGPPLAKYSDNKPYSAEIDNLMRSRGKQHGDQKYGLGMVSGYTGYIPKGQHYFGDRYAIFSSEAIAHMESDQQKYADQKDCLRSLIRDQYVSGLIECDRQRILPLKAHNKKTKMYFPKGTQHSLSPYTYSNADPRKYMLTGYTGFVPKSRQTIGMSYADVTRKALREFTTESVENKATEKAPMILCRPKKSQYDTKPIYIQNSGMVPHYKGHVPGEKFRFGRTFGYSTIKAAALKTNITKITC